MSKAKEMPKEVEEIYTGQVKIGSLWARKSAKTGAFYLSGLFGNHLKIMCFRIKNSEQPKFTINVASLDGKSDLMNVGVFNPKRTKEGDLYFVGNFGQNKMLIKNNFQKSINDQPDYFIYLADEQVKEEVVTSIPEFEESLV